MAQGKATLWTKDEEEYLKKWYNVKTIKEISKALNKTYCSVQHKAQRMELTIKKKKHKTRAWTKDEEEDLLKKYEKKGAHFVAKKLDRSLDSVRRKAQRLNLNSYISGDFYIRTFATCFNTEHRVIERWIEKYGLNCKKTKRGKLVFRIINVKEFWEWAENHKDIIPWHKYESYSLLPEPAWLKEVVKESKDKKKNVRKKITSADINKVARLRKKGKSFEEIAIELQRTVYSVKHIYEMRGDK